MRHPRCHYTKWTIHISLWITNIYYPNFRHTNPLTCTRNVWFNGQAKIPRFLWWICFLWDFDGCFKSFRVVQEYQSTQPSTTSSSTNPLTDTIVPLLPQATILSTALYFVSPAFLSNLCFHFFVQSNHFHLSFGIVVWPPSSCISSTTRTNPNKGFFPRNG